MFQESLIHDLQSHMSHLDIKLKQMQRDNSTVCDESTQTDIPEYRHIHTQTHESTAARRINASHKHDEIVALQHYNTLSQLNTENVHTGTYDDVKLKEAAAQRIQRVYRKFKAYRVFEDILKDIQRNNTVSALQNTMFKNVPGGDLNSFMAARAKVLRAKKYTAIAGKTADVKQTSDETKDKYSNYKQFEPTGNIKLLHLGSVENNEPKILLTEPLGNTDESASASDDEGMKNRDNKTINKKSNDNNNDIIQPKLKIPAKPNHSKSAETEAHEKETERIKYINKKDTHKNVGSVSQNNKSKNILKGAQEFANLESIRRKSILQRINKRNTSLTKK